MKCGVTAAPWHLLSLGPPVTETCIERALPSRDQDGTQWLWCVTYVVCECVCVRYVVCVHACVHACVLCGVRACVHACVCINHVRRETRSHTT